MPAAEIDRLIKASIPDAEVEIIDLAGDDDHFSGDRHVVGVRRHQQAEAASAGLCGTRQTYGRHPARFAASNFAAERLD